MIKDRLAEFAILRRPIWIRWAVANDQSLFWVGRVDEPGNRLSQLIRISFTTEFVLVALPRKSWLADCDRTRNQPVQVQVEPRATLCQRHHVAVECQDLCMACSNFHPWIARTAFGPVGCALAADFCQKVVRHGRRRVTTPSPL